MLDVRRRDFITLLGGTAASWSFAAQAQPLAVPVIGFLSSRSPGESTSVVAALRQGLKEAGYIEGQNVTVEYRWAEGRYDRLPELAKELVARHISLITATGDAVSALAAKGATTTIPIVFVIGGDPVRFGLVARLNRPGGNITGVSLISSGLGAKRLGLLHELLPNAAVFALLLNPDNPNGEPERIDVEEAGRTIGRQIVVVNASYERELDTAFAYLAQQRAGGLLVATDPFFLSRRDQLVELAARHAIPTMYQFREFATASGLMSYGTNITDAYHRAGEYSGRILKGERPADLPIFQQTKLELIINLKTAKMLGLSIPPTLLVFADEVIE
jgi:putative ABC transport system substrate-binding protein